jgi:hypothetical protein
MVSATISTSALVLWLYVIALDEFVSTGKLRESGDLAVRCDSLHCALCLSAGLQVPHVRGRNPEPGVCAVADVTIPWQLRC